MCLNPPILASRTSRTIPYKSNFVRLTFPKFYRQIPLINFLSKILPQPFKPSIGLSSNVQAIFLMTLRYVSSFLVRRCGLIAFVSSFIMYCSCYHSIVIVLKNFQGPVLPRPYKKGFCMRWTLQTLCIAKQQSWSL